MFLIIAATAASLASSSCQTDHYCDDKIRTCKSEYTVRWAKKPAPDSCVDYAKDCTCYIHYSSGKCTKARETCINPGESENCRRMLIDCKLVPAKPWWEDSASR